MTPSKPEILILLQSYRPGFKSGGPIRSISNLVDALGTEFHFRIITQDRDLGDTVPFPGITPNQWVNLGHAEVLYLPSGPSGWYQMWKLLRAVTPETVVYLNSFFNRQFSIFAMLMFWWRLCSPRFLILAPRGEFSPGALQWRTIRKHVYIFLARHLRVYKGVVWHAASELEADNIGRHFNPARQIGAGQSQSVQSLLNQSSSGVVFTAAAIADAVSPGLHSYAGKKPGQLRIVFIGRCSRMKNLVGALRLLHGLEGVISFDIYGPLEDTAYWEECRQVIATLPPNIEVRYRGELEHGKVGSVFAQSHLFLFPTLGESFGHVIAESLAAGCPVLISDQTPWRGLEAAGVGWDIPLADVERFREVLRTCVEAGDDWFAPISRRALGYAVERAANPEVIETNRKLFHGDIGFSGLQVGKLDL